MKRIGRYILEGRLGQGGMSTVYKARAPVTGRIVALKALQPRDEIFVDLVGEKRLREIFLEEARVMGEITHDHVAKILDCDDTGAKPHIILEYFAHSIGSLIGEAYIAERPSRILSVNKTYEYLQQTLLGLERLHFAGIIHRDMKPYNLMITNDDRIKIIDFGLSRIRGEEKMAIPGMQVGSPYYAAPEQESDPKQADERADLFSVGIMAYRMLTGILVSPRQQVVEPASSRNTELNDDWDAFLARSFDPNRRNRFTSARQMRLQLEEIYSSWVRHSQKQCVFVARDQSGPIRSPARPRQQPALIKVKEMQKRFGLDTLMRPKRYPSHHFELKSRDLLHCLDTGLLWQRQGAGFLLNWQMGSDYISYLNRHQWQGHTGWRLPTTEELATLLRPPTLLRDFCFSSYFADDIHWIWSADTCTKKKAWTVDIRESYFQELDRDGMASVCAVTSFQAD